MRSRNTFDFIKLFFKGVFMGIADAMPGVSGGTIALLVGIEDLGPAWDCITMLPGDFF